MTSASASASDALVQPARGSNQRTLWRDAARRFSRNRLAMVGLVIVTFFVFLAVFADVLAPHPYDKVYFEENVLNFPGEHPAHPMGTDEVGRDYLKRMIYGKRTSITVGLAVMAIAVAIGVPIGGIARLHGRVCRLDCLAFGRDYDGVWASCLRSSSSPYGEAALPRSSWP